MGEVTTKGWWKQCSCPHDACLGSISPFTWQQPTDYDTRAEAVLDSYFQLGGRTDWRL